MLGFVFLSLAPLASASWVTPQALTNSTEQPGQVNLAVDPQGNAIAVWKQLNNLRWHVWGARYDSASQTWGQPFVVANADGQTIEPPVVAVDANGNTYVAWVQCIFPPLAWQCTSKVLTRRYDMASASWSPPTTIETDPVSALSGSSQQPSISDISIAAGPNGDAMVVWEKHTYTRGSVAGEQQIFLNDSNSGPSISSTTPNSRGIGTIDTRSAWASHYSSTTGIWGAGIQADDNNSNADSPRVAVDGSGNSLVVWDSSAKLYPASARNYVMAKRYIAATGTWETPVLIGDSKYPAGPRVSLNTVGNGMVVWSKTRSYESTEQIGIFAARFDAAANTWGAPTPVDNALSNVPHKSNSPNIGLDNNGNAVATWRVLELNAPIFAWSVWGNRYNSATGSWDTAKILSTANVYTKSSQLAVDANSGNALAVWVQNPADVWTARYNAGSQMWQAPVLSENNDTGGATDPRVGIDAEGHGVIAWVLNRTINGSNVSSIWANHTNKIVCTDCTLPAGRVGQPYYTSLFPSLGKFSVITGTQGTQPYGVSLMIDPNTQPDPARPHELVLKGTPTACGVYTFRYNVENRVPGRSVDYIPSYGNYLTQKIAILPTENFECGMAPSNAGAPITYPLPNAGRSTDPYWMQYARSFMSDTVNIYHCGNGLSSFGSPTGCPFPLNNNYSLLETHRRASTYDAPNNVTWTPFYGPFSGLRPGYFTADSFNNVRTTYYTLFYLNTDEYDINMVFCTPGTITCAPYKVKKTIWAGEVRDGWGLVPMSPNLINTQWVALTPPGKTFGQNGIGFANFTVSIGGVIAGGGSGPTSGTRLSSRSAYVETQPGVWDIYLTGVCTGTSCYSDLTDYRRTIDNLNQGTIDPFNTTGNVQVTFAKILEIKQSNPNARISLIGHSLGATEATLIYNIPGILGPDDTVYALSVPEGVSADRLLQRPGLARLVVVGSETDSISGGAQLNTQRQNLGVNLTQIRTSGTGLSPHNRCLYQQATFGQCLF